jgi:protein SCO1/2
VLKEYAARFRADEKHWTFATGTEEQINSVAALMGLFHEPESGLISHDLRTGLISPDGRLVHLWKSNVWTPYEVQRMVRETLSGAKDVAVR